MRDVEADLVYDIGMHRGEDAAFYLSRGRRVVGVEANRDLVEVLRERFAAEVRSGQLVILPVALGSHRGTASFYVAREQTGLSSADPNFVAAARRQAFTFDVVEVEMITLDDVMRRHGIPDFMKVDVEGLDHAVVESLAAMPVRPRLLSIESATSEPGATIRAVLAEIGLLTRLGYRRFKLVDQSRLADLDGTVLGREGPPVVYSYEVGASGPFGDEAPGPWRGRAAITSLMVRRLAQHQFLSARGWFAGTAVGGRLRAGAQRLTTSAVPRLHVGRYLGGYEWYDLHAAR